MYLSFKFISKGLAVLNYNKIIMSGLLAKQLGNFYPHDFQLFDLAPIRCCFPYLHRLFEN